MSKFNPEKLSVDFRPNVTSTEPIIPRRYTLTHSDITAELFLTIAEDYAYDKIDKSMRDEVLGEWIEKDKNYSYHVYLNIDSPSNPALTAIRDKIFRRELPLALEAIKHGDRIFFETHPSLNNSPIIVHFNSANPNFNKIENWGTFSAYEIKRTCFENIYRSANNDDIYENEGFDDEDFLYEIQPFYYFYRNPYLNNMRNDII